VFMLAIIADILVQGPFGLLIISYVLMFFIAHFLQTYLCNLNFFKLWSVFALFLCGITCLQCCLFRMIVGFWIPIGLHLMSVSVLILIYPFLMRFCAALDSYVRENT